MIGLTLAVTTAAVLLTLSVADAIAKVTVKMENDARAAKAGVR